MVKKNEKFELINPDSIDISVSIAYIHKTLLQLDKKDPDFKSFVAGLLFASEITEDDKNKLRSKIKKILDPDQVEIVMKTIQSKEARDKIWANLSARSFYKGFLDGVIVKKEKEAEPAGIVIDSKETLNLVLDVEKQFPTIDEQEAALAFLQGEIDDEKMAILNKEQLEILDKYTSRNIEKYIARLKALLIDN